MRARLLLAALLVLAGVTPAAAKEYHAYRFDARIEVLPGGALRVTETIVFAFTSGTFRQVFRTIPTRYTDGVEFVNATMDGRVLPQGEGVGRVHVRRKNGLRVEWNFAPLSSSTHTFELTYIARGVVRQTNAGDLLEWRALPREHDYRIESSTIEVVVPESPSGAPQLEARRVDGGSRISIGAGSVTAHAEMVRRNGSMVLSIPLPRGSVLDGPPGWQTAQAVHRKRMPIWLTIAGAVMAAGLVILFALRQSYDPPPRDVGVRWQSMIPPAPMAPAIAGALASNGSVQLEHAMATLFSLAERGVIAIREAPKALFGQRTFMLERIRGAAALERHEQAAMDIVFGGASSADTTVPLSKARSQMTRHWSRFKSAVQQELAAAQLTDPARRASRKRFERTGLVVLLLSAAAIVPGVFLVETNGRWPMLIAAALLVVALTAFIISASQTPLSNEGVRRAEEWRAFKKHLSDPQSIEPRWGAAGTAEARILPFAVALGLAAAWSKYLKKSHAPTPAWFEPASALEGGRAFSAFVATGGAGAHGSGAGAGAGGVAGGGASGAR